MAPGVGGGAWNKVSYMLALSVSTLTSSTHDDIAVQPTLIRVAVSKLL